VTGLRHSVQQLAESVESVRRYTTAVQNELTKRQAGTATLLDVVNMEDRLVSAQVAEIAARQAYAVAIAQLRYETGTLVRKDGNTFDVRIRDVLYPDFSASQ
jgi:outer membrane protein